MEKSETVITMTVHRAVCWRIRRRDLWIQGMMVLTIFALLVVPYAFKLKADVMTEGYRMARAEIGVIRTREKLLTLLRSKSMSVGVGLDVADVALRQNAVPLHLVLGLIDVESGFDPHAVSKRGARGLTQVMPVNSKASHLSIHDPVVNMRAGLELLAGYKEQYGTWERALRAYDGGPKNADNPKLDKYANLVLARAETYRGELEVR